MISIRRLVIALCVLGLANASVRAEVQLVGQRVERQEITELRYTAPDGCVITGLGFRAHADNITTMHCRYHRLAPDGRLVDPEEVRLGAEPDHACEAKVLLPDGWVAVGFGAAGEPEWDVALVRVWARKLNPDGTLGEEKVFSDGFKPDRGTEREIILSDPDRVLCSAGIRFGFNDISGVFAASRRIIHLDERAQDRLGPLRKQVWLVKGMQATADRAWAEALRKTKVDRVDLNPGPPAGDTGVHYINAMSSLADAAGIPTHVWLPVREAKDAVARLAPACPGIKGIVLDAAAGEVPSVSLVEDVAAACRQANLAVSLRIDPKTAGVQDLIRSLPASTALILSDLPLRDDLLPPGQDRDLLIELNLADRAAASAGLPDVNAHELAGWLVEARLIGANGVVVLVNQGPSWLTDNVNRLGLEVLAQLAADPFQSPGPVVAELCNERYGAARQPAYVALQHAADANDLIFGTLGIRFLWGEGGIRTVPAARDRLRSRSEVAAGAEGEAIRQLLAPTDDTVEQCDLEAETALWLIRQSVTAAEQARQAAPGPRTHLLSLAVEKNRCVAAFCNAVGRVFVLTRMYAQDISPITRWQINSTLEKLPGLAGEVSQLLGDSAITHGLDPFIASVRQALAESEEKAPLARAFGRVKTLLAEGRHDEAVRSLSGILHDPSLAPHLEKNKATVVELVNPMKALWGCPDDRRVLRGADGRWTLEEKNGKWAWASQEEAPCIYFDILIDELEKPADYVLSFEYFDEGNHRIAAHYDSHYPGDARERQYHPTEPVQLTDTGTWKTATREMTRCRFSSGQNEAADLRFLPAGEGRIYIRNVSIRAKQGE